MTESYREMEARHAIADDQMYWQDNMRRWAGLPEYQDAPDPDPNTVQDCTNCRYAINSQAPYWCSAYRRMTYGDGVTGCSGWSWDPVEEAAA